MSATAQSGGAPAAELRGASLTYPGPPPLTALQPVDLTIDCGDYVAVVGPSGSGKTTLVNLLGLLDRPSGGAVLIDGVDVTRMSERYRAGIRARRIGSVFQAFHLLSHRTALENVMLAQIYSGLPRTARGQLATDALARVGLSHRAHALPTQLSGGERQRVAVARALLNRPGLLLCDEPTGNLDTRNTEGILDLFDDLHHSGVTLVVITHNPDVAARAERRLSITDGVLTETTPCRQR